MGFFQTVEAERRWTLFRRKKDTASIGARFSNYYTIFSIFLYNKIYNRDAPFTDWLRLKRRIDWVLVFRDFHPKG